VESCANGPLNVANGECAHVPPICDAGIAARKTTCSRM
jgi:hypothetical protein